MLQFREPSFTIASRVASYARESRRYLAQNGSLDDHTTLHLEFRCHTRQPIRVVFEQKVPFNFFTQLFANGYTRVPASIVSSALNFPSQFLICIGQLFCAFFPLNQTFAFLRNRRCLQGLFNVAECTYFLKVVTIFRFC